MTSTPTSPAEQGDPGGHGLQRRLTSRQVMMIGLGGAIGTGLFLGSSLAISQAGPSTIIAYIVCALVALVIAWALAEMVVVHPVHGGFGSLAHSYIGPWAGFVVRWTYWTIQVIAIGGEVIAAGIYVQYWWPQLPLWVPTVIFAVAILALNATTVKLFGTVEYWFAMIKVTAIIVFILLGLALVFLGLPGHQAIGLDNLTAHGGFFPKGLKGLFLAMVFVIFSFIGTELVSVTAAEAENPTRDIARAARAMMVRLALFYVIAISLVLAVAPWTETASKGSKVDSSPFVMMLATAQVPAAATIMNFVVLTAALSSANANLYLTTRMLHSLSAHRFAPRWAGELNRSGVPAKALALSAIGLAIAGAVSYLAEDSAYLALFGISVFGALVVWMLILITHLRFRHVRRRLGLPDSPVRLFAASVTTILALLFLAMILLSTPFIDGLQWTWIAGIPFFAVLVIIYLAIRRRGNPTTEDPLAAELDRTRNPERPTTPKGTDR